MAHDADSGATWKTIAQLQAERAPTPKEALGEMRAGLGTARRRLPVRPEFQEPWPFFAAAPSPSPPPPSRGDGEGDGGLVGYRAPPATWGGQRGASLLSGLGAKLREAQVLEGGGSAGDGDV